MSDELLQWHKWYAWRPVKVDGNWKWRATVGRKYRLISAYDPEQDRRVRYHGHPLYCTHDELLVKKLQGPEEIVYP